MTLFPDIETRRELLERLILAELLARPGQGPLAPRFARWARGGARGVQPVTPAPRLPEQP